MTFINRTATIDSYEGRELIIRALSFDREYVVSDGGPAYRETYDRKAFNRTLSHKGETRPLYTLHDTKKLPVGSVTFHVDADALHARAQIVHSAAGDEVLELVRMGVLKDFSIGGTAISPTKVVNGKIHRTEVALREGSLVPFGALDDAEVLTIRQEIDTNELEMLRLKYLYITHSK